MRDLTSTTAIKLKGVLFVVLGLLAGALLWVELPTWKTAALLAVCVWAFCRAYYFAFYVIERYVDPQFKFAGLWSAVRCLVKQSLGRRSRENPAPTLVDLEARLRASQDAFHAHRKSPWNQAASLKLHDEVHAAEAALAAAKGEPYATTVDIGLEYCADGVRLLQSSEVCLLIFGTFLRRDGIVTERGYGIMRFPECQWTTFGYPNDEAMEGHPFAGKGLNALKVCEVFNSPWIERMKAQNKTVFPNFDIHPCRHFLIVFGDDTFECICTGWELLGTHTDFSSAWNHAASFLEKE